MAPTGDGLGMGGSVAAASSYTSDLQLLAPPQPRPTYARGSRSRANSQTARAETNNQQGTTAADGSHTADAAAAAAAAAPFMPLTPDHTFSPYVRGQTTPAPATPAVSDSEDELPSVPIGANDSIVTLHMWDRHGVRHGDTVAAAAADAALGHDRHSAASGVPTRRLPDSSSRSLGDSLVPRVSGEAASHAAVASALVAAAASPSVAGPGSAGGPEGGLVVSLATGRVLDVPAPSSLHGSMHFVLRFTALAMLLMCALIRTNVWGLAYYVLFFISAALIAFARFRGNSRANPATQQPQRRGGRGKYTGREVIDMPAPQLSPLTPFLLPGLVLSVLGLLAISAIQLARRFHSSYRLRGDLLRQFGMSYTEPADRDNIAVLFVPYLVAALFFAGALIYERWKLRHLRRLTRSGEERRTEEIAALADFERKNLTDPIRRLDELLADSGVAAFDPAQKALYEADIKARYTTQLEQFKIKAKETRRKEAARHRGTSQWSWFECKVYHPLFHILAFVLLLLVGLLERSVLSYVYFLLWSVVLTKWALWDRARHLTDPAGQRPPAAPLSVPPSASHSSNTSNANTAHTSRQTSPVLATRSIAQQRARLREEELQTNEIELTGLNGHARHASASTNMRATPHPPLSIHVDTTSHMRLPSVDGAATSDGAPPAPQPLCSSFFPSFPTYTSFPVLCSHLPLFRLYQFVWLYSAAHLLLKYIFRGLYIFNYGNDTSVDLPQLKSEEAAWDSHLLFYMGEYALPPGGMNQPAPHNMYVEEGFHLGLLLALNLYLALLCHLARKPFVYMPVRWGTRLLASRESIAAERAVRMEAKRRREERHRERLERHEARAAERARTAGMPVPPGSKAPGAFTSPVEDEARRAGTRHLSPYHSSSPPLHSPEASVFSPASGVLSSSGSERDGRRHGMRSPDSAPAAPPVQHARENPAASMDPSAEGAQSAGPVLDKAEVTNWPAASSSSSQSQPAAPPVLELTLFEKLATGLGRSIWLLLPAGCFMLAVLYSAYPSLLFLLCMFLSAYFSLSVSFHLLPFLFVYTQCVNHAIYIFHLPGAYWDQETGADYLSHLTTPDFVALLLASLGAVILGAAHKYAREAIAFWESVHGFEHDSLTRARAGASPLGLLSPKLGQREKHRREEEKKFKEQVRVWKEEDQAARAERARSRSMAAAGDEGEATHWRIYRPPDTGDGVRGTNGVASADHALGRIHEEDEAHDEHTQPRTPAQLQQHRNVSPPEVVFHIPPSPSPDPPPMHEAKDGEFRIVMSPVDSSSPLHGQHLSSPISPLSPKFNVLHAVSPQMRAVAVRHAQQKLEAHVGYPSKEAYAAALIQAAYRGRKARRHMESAGIPVVLPEERRILTQLEQADHQRRSDKHAAAASAPPPPVHHHHRYRSSPDVPSKGTSSGRPSWLRRSWLRVRRVLMDLVLVFFSYSNLLIMIMLYVLGILRVDFIHAFYMLLFLAYAISPWMRRKHGLVVIYASLVIFVTYAWSLTYLRDSEYTNNSWTDRVGLVSIRPFNRLLYPHVAILLLAGIFHRFSPEEAAQAQLRLNRMVEAKERREKKLAREAARAAAGTVSTAEEEEEEAAEAEAEAAQLMPGASATSAYVLTPYHPLYRTAVTVGLLCCTGVTLWAGLVNSLMGDSADPVSALAAAISNPQNATTQYQARDIGVSLIAAVYLFFVFALLLIHQLRPGIRAFPLDRGVLFLLAVYSGCIVLLQYVYQFDVLDSAMERLAELTDGRFTAAEIGVFKTAGSLYRSLLSHSIVLLVCVGELRLLRMDIATPATAAALATSSTTTTTTTPLDPASSPATATSSAADGGGSISLLLGKHGSTVENVLTWLEKVLHRTELRLAHAALAKADRRRAKMERKQYLARRQARKMAAFEANDLIALNARADEDLDELDLKQQQQQQQQAAEASGDKLPPAPPVIRAAVPHKRSPFDPLPDRPGGNFLFRRSQSTTLLLHFFARVSYYSLLFTDWFLLQHTDKLLALTLFLVSVEHVSLIGAWYLILGFICLLVLGYPRAKVLSAMLSAQLFILVQMFWQFPTATRSGEIDKEALGYDLLGLRVRGDFGALVFPHLAVMLVAAFYGATYFWLRVHQRRMMRAAQRDEFEQYQDAMRCKAEMGEQEEAAAAAAAASADAEHGAGSMPDQMGANASASFDPSFPATGSLLGAPASSSAFSSPGRARGQSDVSGHRRQLSLMPNSPGVPSTTRDLMPTLLATLPSPDAQGPGGAGTGPAAHSAAGAPMLLSPVQHQALVLYSHLSARESAAQYESLHAHPSSHKDDAIQELGAMNLAILSQSNVGPSERKGRPRYEAPMVVAPAGGASADVQPFSPQLNPAEEIRRIDAAAALDAQHELGGGVRSPLPPSVLASAPPAPLPRSQSRRDASLFRSPSPPTAPAPPLTSLDDATGELSNSDAEENPLKYVKSWMMRVPLSEHSHRLTREKKLAAEQRRRQRVAAQRLAQEDEAASFSADGALLRRRSYTGSAADLSAVRESTSPSAASGRAPAASSLSGYTSPRTLNDEAGMFALASSSLRLNQVEQSSATFVHNVKYVRRDGDDDRDEITRIQGRDGLLDAATLMGKGKHGGPAPFGSALRVGLVIRGEGDGMDGNGVGGVHSSFAHRFVKGLLGDEGLCVYIGRFMHYFGFFHLALLSLMCASYSNANTLFSLYYIFVTGLLSYVGTQTANRYWKPLVASLTLCLLAKYAVALANETPQYHCGSSSTEAGCGRWVIWAGKGTRLFYWDVVAWMMVVIHHSALRIYAKIEREMVERARKEREEPWEIRGGAMAAMGEGGDSQAGASAAAFSNPVEKAAFEGTAEGALETYAVRTRRSGDDDDDDDDVGGVYGPRAPAPLGSQGVLGPASPLRVRSEPVQASSVSPGATSNGLGGMGLSFPTSAVVVSPTNRIPGDAMRRARSFHTADGQVVHRFTPSMQFPPFHPSGAAGKQQQKKAGVTSPSSARSKSKSVSSAVRAQDATSPALPADAVAPPAESGELPGLSFNIFSAPPAGDGSAAAAATATVSDPEMASLLYEGRTPPPPPPARTAPAGPAAGLQRGLHDLHNVPLPIPGVGDESYSAAALRPLSPSGFPSYKPSVSEIAPVPSFITVTYTTINNQLASYVMGNFMENTKPNTLPAAPGQTAPRASVSDFAHMCVFRGAHYLAVLLVIAFACTYFNLLNLVYLTLAFLLLWGGDAVLEGSSYLWDQLYIWTYLVVLLRLLYQMPLFRMTRVVTNWSTVIGLYKVTRDDCNFDADQQQQTPAPPGFGQAPLDPCAASPFDGVVSKVLIMDILIFGTVLLMRTLLARREMVFVRQYIRDQRRVAAMRFELISLQMEADRLRRTLREQSEAISRLVRVEQLKAMKVAREEMLQREREATGQASLIEGWEGAGKSLGMKAFKAKGKGRGRGGNKDEDAMARNSIRNHAINQIKMASLGLGPVVPVGGGPPGGAGIISATAGTGMGSDTKGLAGSAAPLALSQPIDENGTTLSPELVAAHNEDVEAAALRTLAQNKLKLASLDRQRSQEQAELVPDSALSGTEKEASDDAGRISDSFDGGARRAVPPSASAPSSRHVHMHRHRHHSDSSDSTDSEAEAAAEDPDTYRAAQAATEFELHLVEERMAQLKRKRAIARLNRADELPLLARRFMETRWVQTVIRVFTSDKHNVFRDENILAPEAAIKIQIEQEENARAAARAKAPASAAQAAAAGASMGGRAVSPMPLPAEKLNEESAEDVAAERRRDIEAAQRARRIDEAANPDLVARPSTPADDDRTRKAEHEMRQNERQARHPKSDVVTEIDPAAGATTRTFTAPTPVTPPTAAAAAAAAGGRSSSPMPSGASSVASAALAVHSAIPGGSAGGSGDTSQLQSGSTTPVLRYAVDSNSPAFITFTSDDAADSARMGLSSSLSRQHGAASAPGAYGFNHLPLPALGRPRSRASSDASRDDAASAPSVSQIAGAQASKVLATAGKAPPNPDADGRRGTPPSLDVSQDSLHVAAPTHPVAAAQGERNVVVAPIKVPATAAGPTATFASLPKGMPASSGGGVGRSAGVGVDDDDPSSYLPPPSLVSQTWDLFTRVFLGSTWFMVCFFFMLQYLVQPSLLSLMFPFSLFLYALLTYPRPPRTFWEGMILYTMLLLLLKYLFQLPAFCVCETIFGQSYSICGSDNSVSCGLTEGVTLSNPDTNLGEVIGLEKLVPRHQAHSGRFMYFIGQVMLDLFTLFALGFHRRYLRIHGLWLRRQDFKLLKQRHELLMRRLVRHGLLKESVRKWQQGHEEDLRTQQRSSRRTARNSAIVSKLKKMYAVEGEEEHTSSNAHATSHLKQQQQHRRSVTFNHSKSQPSVWVDMDALQRQKESDTQHPKRGSIDRVSSATYAARGERDAADGDGGALLSDKTRRRQSRHMKRQGTMPLLFSSASSQKADPTVSSPRRASAAPPSLSKSAASEQAPVARTTSWTMRMKSMMQRGSDRLRRVVRHGDKNTGGDDADADDDDDDEFDEQGQEEGDNLLARDARTPSPNKRERKASVSASAASSLPVPSHASLSLDLHRAQARSLLRKQKAAQAETKFQRSLKAISSHEERRQALEAHRKEVAEEAAREERREKRLQKRLAKQRALLNANEGEGGKGAKSSKSSRKRSAGPGGLRGFKLRCARLWHYFTRTVRDTTYKPGKDLYIYIFLVQLLQFIVLVIFYNFSSSVSGAGNVVSENYISPQFVLVIFAQFTHIIVERVIYLYRALLWKLALQLATMITFFIIALYEGMTGSALLSVVYVLMCLYWLLSSLQFYHGYPASTQGQFLAKSTHWLPKTIFMAYRAIPFVFELRTLLDWICTDTVLYFPQWLKFEDIYATFFLTQCACDARKNNARHPGEKQGWCAKLGIGLGLFILLVIVVWGPLFLFSSQAATSPNPVLRTQLQVAMPDFLALYETEQQYVVGSGGNEGLSEGTYASIVDQHPVLEGQRRRGLQIIYPLGAASSVWTIAPLARQSMQMQLAQPEVYGPHYIDFTFSFMRSASTAAPNTRYGYRYTLTPAQSRIMSRILNGTNVFSAEQIANTTLPGGLPISSTGEADTGIPGQQLRRLLQIDAASSSTGDDSSSSSSSSSSSAGDISSSSSGAILLPSSSTGGVNPDTGLLSGNRSSSLFLPACYPAFYYMSSIDSDGGVDVLDSDGRSGFNNCLLTLVVSVDPFGNARESWQLSDAGSFGQVSQQNTPATSAALLALQGRPTPGVLVEPDGSNVVPPLPITTAETYATGYRGIGLGPPIYMYSGELPSGSSLNYGLVGVYVTVVLAIGRFLRMYVMGTSKNIMWDDLQDALPVLNMCRDLYTARLHKQLKLEQQLYVELINLLRSPETLLARTGEYIHYYPLSDSDSSSSSSESSQSDSSDDEYDSDDGSSPRSRTGSRSASLSSDDYSDSTHSASRSHSVAAATPLIPHQRANA